MRRPFPLLLVSCVLLLLAGLVPLPAQSGSGAELHVTTLERLESEAWWPTMGKAPLSSYTGSATCQSCHTPRPTAGTATGMQHAATRAIDARFLSGHEPNTFHSGDLTYTLAMGPNGPEYSVSRGGERVTRGVGWVLGAGHLARTFLYQSEGRWYQSETSFYTGPGTQDITTGFGPSGSPALGETLGNVLSPAEARTCFNCHTVRATTPAGLDPQHAEAGIGCEGCHGPGAAHAAGMAATGKPAAPEASSQLVGDLRIFDPGKLSPADSIDFCGSCHRTFADASLSTGPSTGSAAVRFQPYRLEESRCWRATQDARLTCVACHDPHRPLNRVAASYDRNCLECHSGGTTHALNTGRVCPRASHECVTCHMPRVDLPSMHGAFTDHFIRVARAGEPLPR